MANPVISQTIESAAPAAHNFSMWCLFMGADIIVQAIIILLGGASIVSWAIIFSKTLQLRDLNNQAKSFEGQFWNLENMNDIEAYVSKRKNSYHGQLCLMGLREWRRLHDRPSEDFHKKLALFTERVMRVHTIYIRACVQRLQKKLVFLATVGSTAPFVGLFGTVWGIMHSFQSIAAMKNTSLVVVAPGIAEALFATALGLVAAIPAVMAYNRLSQSVNRYIGQLENFSDEIIDLLQQQ